MTNHVNALRHWLKTNFCICVPDDWLEACVEWIQEENQGSQIQFTTLRNQVYEQWLMSDLRELKTASLPEEVTVNRKMELVGNFALQVDSAIDAGCSFYSQMQKVKGTENDNAAVSGEAPRQPAWEPKPTRMMILNITDGVANVRAMEYKPIKDISPFMTPGTKILVKGPVLCRLGVLMLGPENVQILGGEVDSLVEANTREALLNSAMQEGQENSGKSEKQEFSGRMLTSGENKKDVKMQQPRPPPTFIKREPVSQSTQHTRGNDHKPQMKHEPADPDWEDDFDYDALMADMDTDGPHTGHRNNTNQRMKTEPQSRPTSSRNENMNMGHDDFMDDFEEDFDIPNTSMRQTVKQEPQSQQSQVRPQISGPSSSRAHGNKTLDTTSRMGKIFTKPTTVSQKEEKISQNLQQNCEIDEFDDDFMMDDLEFGDGKSADWKKSIVDTSRLLSDLPGTNMTISAPFQSSTPTPDPSFTSIKGNLPKAVIHPFHGEASNRSPQATGRGQQGKGQSRMDRFFGSSSDSSPARAQATAETDHSFSYLSDILPRLPVQEPLEVVIKGYISTLTSKLTSCGGKAWSLSCKVNDGTGVINVDLSNNVLTKLIGISAKDSMVMKHRAKADPSVKEVLAEGLTQCQQTLTDLSSLMKIQFLPNQIKPVIIQIIPVTSSHVHALYDKIIKKYEKR